MTLESLRCLCAIIETRSFRTAAERLHRSQPAMGEELRTLKADLLDFKGMRAVKGLSGLLFLGPKGQHSIAQGNALGTRATHPNSPERATQLSVPRVSRKLHCPYRAARYFVEQFPGRCPGLCCIAPLGRVWERAFPSP